MSNKKSDTRINISSDEAKKPKDKVKKPKKKRKRKNKK